MSLAPGVKIFGIVGLVMGPLLLSYFVVLMQVFARENLHQHLMPAMTTGKVEEILDEDSKIRDEAGEISCIQ